MEDSSRPSLTPSALALIGIVIVAVLAGIFSYRAVESNRTALYRANRARLALQTYLTLVVDQETAVRAYDATNGTSPIDFLEPYREAGKRYRGVLQSILEAGGDSDLQTIVPYVRRADALHARWVRAVAGPILAGGGKSALDVSREIEGKRLMDAVRGQIAAAQRVSDAMVVSRRSAAGAAVAVSIAVIVLFVVAAGLLALRSEARFAADQRRLRAQIEERNVALERSNAALQEFAFVASHDLQEPLRAVSGFTQLLRKRYGAHLDAEAGEFIDFAVDGALRMQELIDDILTYSRVTTHGKPLEPTDLGEAAQRAVENLRFAIDERSAGVRIDSLPYVYGDPTQLTQLLQNLIGNAVKYGGERPHVQVSAERHGEVWRLCVADNGIGIAPEHQDRVFRIFQRLHTRAEYGGTGIGLAICRGIVERHGGRIWVESNAGAGAKFYFTLRDAKESKEPA